MGLFSQDPSVFSDSEARGRLSYTDTTELAEQRDLERG